MREKVQVSAKPSKIFRDPLYNYISVDRENDAWLLALLDTREVQRLRRIHQLGVSNFTYPGADHNRLAHTLGVVHLMQQALAHLGRIDRRQQIKQARAPLLAAALLHDVGHGPFSHLFEPCLGIAHEEWSIKIVKDPETNVHKILKSFDKYLPSTVADLIDTDNRDHPAWQKALLSSQLDMDRLDYLRRDSLFTGAGYGHFDFYRILNSFVIDDNNDLVWSEGSKLAIEEYIFARYYMYQNVYLHKTTRGFEKMLEAMWRRARSLSKDGTDVDLLPAIGDFWEAENPTVKQYLRIEEFTVMQQIQQWADHADKPLSDLARRFLQRERYAAVEPPRPDNELASANYDRWERALADLLKKHGYTCVETHLLRDELKAKYNQPYFPEKEGDQQSARNAIRVRTELTGEPEEISTQLERLRPITTRPAAAQVRYYLPPDMRAEVQKLRNDWRDIP
jgi:HD superfamily phosphohydrolase